MAQKLLEQIEAAQVYIGKKKIKSLQTISVYDGVLQYHGFTFQENCPDMWLDSEKQIFDIVTEVEHRMHKAYLEVLGAPQDNKE